MTIDIQPAGSILRVPRYVWERPPHSLSRTIRRVLGVAPKAKRRLAGVDEIPCPFAFALVHGAKAEAALNEMAHLRPDCTAIILGKPETAANMFGLRLSETYESLLANLDEFNLDRWLAGRFAEFKQFGTEPPRGPWPARRDEASGLFSVRRPLGDRDFEPEVVVALVPTSEPALAPLHLGFGSWNDCPAPVVHAALARRWRELCGAVPVAFAGDVVEYRVPDPITTREQAIEVALEQFAYCPDIVLQGTETIERLAAGLVDARYWFFWWD